VDNYPDDIRSYDNDPRSPFYDEEKHANSEARKEAEEIEADNEYDRRRDDGIDPTE
jgi:hypothetical protein